MPKRLFACVALVLMGLLPIETAYAVSGCAPLAAMDSDCGDCINSELQHCRSYCIALCQTLPVARMLETGAQAKKSSDHYAHEAVFPTVLSGGPEPPPPRTLR